MIPSDELTALRAVVAATLTGSGSLRRRTLTDNGNGTYSQSWASTTVNCRVAPINSREAEVAARLGLVATWVITLPYGTTVVGEDEITVGGRTFKVTGVLDGGSLATAVRVYCTEVR